MSKRLAKDEFYSQIWKLILPIVIQNLLTAAISSADVIMLNFVGQSAISSVSLATQYANILFSFYYGLGTGATMLCAQYYGKGDMRAVEVVEGIALRFSVIISSIFALCALLIPNQMMTVFTKDPELIELGASYLRIISISYFCWGIIEIYFSVLRSIERVAICTILNSIAFVFNIVFNAVFIFGLFGVPRMGVVGVAIATSASRVIALIGCIIVSACSKEAKLKLSSLFVRNRVLFKDFIRLTAPALGNDIAWGVAFSLYAAIIGHLGSDAVAANSFVVVVRNLGTILCFGIASAGSILLGKIIGENRLEDARQGAKKLMKLTIISGVIGGIIVLASMPIVMKYASASLSDTAMHYLKIMMLINSYYVMGAAVNTTLIAGVFRSGGDARFGFICDFIDMWLYALPLGYIAAFVLELPVLWVYFLLCTDEFVKWPWVIKHYRSGKWLNNITRDSSEINTDAA